MMTKPVEILLGKVDICSFTAVGSEFQLKSFGLLLVFRRSLGRQLAII